jgi:Domain of unknown function (DUF3471)
MALPKLSKLELTFGKALVLRDIPSWNRHPDFEDVLKDLGLPFDVNPSSEMSNINLAGYDFVVIPGAQWGTNYYNAFAANTAMFERYVNNGGTLVVEMNRAEQAGITLPGGVSMVTHPSFDNLITFPDHPIFEPLAGKPRITANLASHGYLMDIPGGALILAAEMDPWDLTADMSKPTFVEYTCGKGRILAAAQCFHDQDNSGRGPLMPTLLKYAAAKQWVAAGTAPSTSIAPATTDRVEMDPRVLDRYVGHYSFPGNRIMTVTRDGDRLLIQLSGQPQVPIFAKSEREFFAKVVDAQITLVTNAQGEATQLVLHQNGQDITAPRMNEAAAQAQADALATRVREQKAAPGSEAALRRHIEALQDDQPNYDDMAPVAAAATRPRWPTLKEQFAHLGQLQSITFKGVGPAGADIYEARFEKRAFEWRIHLTSEGKIDVLNFRPSPGSQT